MFGFKINQPRTLLVKVLVIFVPVFAIAHITQNMVYVLPTLAIGVLFGASLNQSMKKEDGDIDGEASDS